MLFGNSLEGKLVRAWHYMGENESIDTLPLLYDNQRDNMNWDNIINAREVLPFWMIKLAKKGKKKEGIEYVAVPNS